MNNSYSDKEQPGGEFALRRDSVCLAVGHNVKEQQTTQLP